MRLLWRLVAGLCLLGVTYFSAALVGAVIPGAHSEIDGPRDQQIRLVAGPIHYDILLPLSADTKAAFGFLTQDILPIDHPDAQWLAVGWGSEAFYTATASYLDLNLHRIWTAASGDESVLRFEVAGDIPVGGKVRALDVSERQMATLRGAILQELDRDATGAPRSLEGVRLTGRDVFYHGQTGFSLLRTCNVWVGAVLRRAGIQMGRWTPTPYAVTLSLKWFHG